jgi:hypothetical protein
MTTLSKRKLANQADEGSNSNVSQDTIGGVLRPSKRLNTTLLGPAVVHAGDRVAYNQFPSDENEPWVHQARKKKVDKSDTLEIPLPVRKTPFGAVLEEAVVPKLQSPRSIANHILQTSIDTVPRNANLSFLDDMHSESGTVVSFTTLPTAKASLNNIPEELVVGIFNLLRGDSSTFYNISLVNRRCRRIALEPLYSTFSSEDILRDAGTYVSAGRAFVRSIVSDGDLAQKVQSLTWVYNVNTVVQGVFQKYRPDKKERIAFQLYLNQLRLGHEAASMWMDKLYDARREVNQLAIALLRSPNLQELAIYDDSTFPKYSEYDLEWMHVLTHAACGFSPKFEQLRNISINVRGAHFRVWAISDILLLPSLRKFSLSGAVESGPLDASLWHCPNSASGVEDLALAQCFFDSRVVAKFLSSCKAIKEFAYSYDSAHWEPLSFGNINANTWAQHSWTTIRAALEKHRDTLQVLKLEDNSDPEIVDVMHLFVVDHGHLGSLRGFPKLHEIQAPSNTLTSSEVATSDGAPMNFASRLPRGIRTVKLIFDGYMDLLSDYTTPLVALKNGRLDRTLPDLRRVSVCLKDDVNAGLLLHELFEPIKVLKKEGIDVKVMWGENADLLDQNSLSKNDVQYI